MKKTNVDYDLTQKGINEHNKQVNKQLHVKGKKLSTQKPRNKK